MKIYKTNIKEDYAINIVVALSCEAKALIKNLSLKKAKLNCSLQIFSNYTKTINLVVSGIGEVKSAIGTSFLAAYAQKQKQAFINFGIAGGNKHQLGGFYLANKITSAEEKLSFYPFLLPATKNKRAEIITYQAPQNSIETDNLADMEAFSFYQAAKTFTTKEYIQVCKVVSDNNSNCLAKINTTFVENLISKELEKIIHLVQCYQKVFMKNEEQNKSFQKRQQTMIEELESKWHFSSYQKIELNEALRRWQVVFKENIDLSQVKNLKSSSEILTYIFNKLDAAAYIWQS